MQKLLRHSGCSARLLRALAAYRLGHWGADSELNQILANFKDRESLLAIGVLKEQGILPSEDCL
jgi:hypothetical protein